MIDKHFFQTQHVNLLFFVRHSWIKIWSDGFLPFMAIYGKLFWRIHWHIFYEYNTIQYKVLALVVAMVTFVVKSPKIVT